MRLGPVRLLVVINLLLAAGLAWMWLDEHGQWRNITWAAPAALLPEVNQLAAAGVPVGPQVVNPTQYLAILERPIFAPDRRPPPPPAPPPPPDPMADVQITGIFSGAQGGVLARVEGKVRRVKVNESIGAWSLKSIAGRDVTFVQGEQTRQLHLDYTRLGIAPAQSQEQVGAVRSAGGVAPSSVATQNNQDEMRDRLRRRNEIRAARGLPPVTD
jgi:hypothetical protein